MKRIGWIAAVLVAGVASLIAGIALGFVIGVRVTRGTAEMGEMMFVAWQGQTAFLQYQHANDRNAEKALLEYVGVLQRLPVGRDSFHSKESVAVDLTLTYVRLAKIAARQGDESRAHVYISKAQENCSLAGWKDCSTQQIQAITDRIDQNVGGTRELLREK
jgi:hypothetical protein